MLQFTLKGKQVAPHRTSLIRNGWLRSNPKKLGCPSAPIKASGVLVPPTCVNKLGLAFLEIKALNMNQEFEYPWNL